MILHGNKSPGSFEGAEYLKGLAPAWIRTRMMHKLARTQLDGTRTNYRCAVLLHCWRMVGNPDIGPQLAFGEVRPG